MNIFITGASSGIGESLAYYYAQKGDTVGLVARREDRLKAVEDKVKELGGNPISFILDRVLYTVARLVVGYCSWSRSCNWAALGWPLLAARRRNNARRWGVMRYPRPRNLATSSSNLVSGSLTFICCRQ